jgi:multiple sugar transport system permease protein
VQFANFVPCVADLRRGPPAFATTFLPLFGYTTAFEYLRYGYAATATLVMSRSGL